MVNNVELSVCAKRQKKNNAMFKLLMTSLILGTDALLFSYNANSFLPQLAEYLQVILSICMLGYALIKKKMITNKHIFLALVIGIWMLFLGVYHGEFSGGYISKISLFLIGTSFFAFCESEKFASEYINIMYFICLCSLVGIVLSNLIIKLAFIPTITNTNGYQFKSLFFTNISYSTPYRNYGPFSEPSRFQAYINLFLVFLFFDNNIKNKTKYIVVALLALFTTFSTTGYISFVLIVLAFLVKKNVNISKWKKYNLLAIFSIILFILFGISEDFMSAINKFSMGTASTSFTVRFNSIVANIKIISENLLFGTGIRNHQQAFVQAVMEFSNNTEFTNTNTLLLTFAKFGVVIGSYFVLNLTRTIWKISTGLSAIILFFAFFAFTSGISFLDSIIFNVVVFYHNNIPINLDNKSIN